MKLNAYVLAADPTWIQASVLSYYEIVSTLIISYDKRGLGWTGVPVPVEESLALLRAIDEDHKMKFIAGDFARLEHSPIENDTYQRRCALEQASANCDWVLMLDSDEVLPDAGKFVQRLRLRCHLFIKAFSGLCAPYSNVCPTAPFLKYATHSATSMPNMLQLRFVLV